MCVYKGKGWGSVYLCVCVYEGSLEEVRLKRGFSGKKQGRSRGPPRLNVGKWSFDMSGFEFKGLVINRNYVKSVRNLI